MATDLAEKQRKEAEPDEPQFPDDGEHTIVVKASGFNGPAPEGHDADRLQYDRGDELPAELGERMAYNHPHTLAVLNKDGEVVFGGENHGDDAVIRAINTWSSGEGFDPSEYE